MGIRTTLQHTGWSGCRCRISILWRISVPFRLAIRRTKSDSVFCFCFCLWLWLWLLENKDTNAISFHSRPCGGSQDGRCPLCPRHTATSHVWVGRGFSGLQRRWPHGHCLGRPHRYHQHHQHSRKTSSSLPRSSLLINI